MTAPPKTDRLGVSSIEKFFSYYGWLFREQYLHDYGIDAHVEIVDDDGKPTGSLIAIQVKSGPSHFSESTESSFIFRSENRHVKYWMKHSLPVIVALYDINEDKIYWESVSEESLINTGKGWKIEIPKNKFLSEESLSELCNLTQPPPDIQKLNRLRLDRYWIELLSDDEDVYIEFEDWINKSLPRFEIKIGCKSRDDIEEESWPAIYGVGLSLEEAIAYVFPWADFEMDEDAYYDFMEEKSADGCYMGRDEDGDIRIPEGIVPVSESGGETEGYRLILSLNELGKSFLILDDYLAEEDYIENRTFTLV
jgi:hypothetical protein